MSHADASSLTPQGLRYLGLWNDLAAEGLGRLLGAQVTVEPLAGVASETSAEATKERGLWIRFFAGKAGEQACFLPLVGAVRLSRLLLGGPSGETTGEAEDLPPEGREAVVQFFQQIAVMIPSADWLGFSCEIAASEAERIEWEPAGEAVFRFSSAQGNLLDLRALLSADFSSALRLPEEKAPSSRPDQQPAPPPRAAAHAPRDVNLDLLLDVELNVTLRFGQREMLLGDILNLAPGSVVELDQQVQDPVQLLVGDKVIAWGEVVVVDGNYGLRVMDLASREERIESLRT